RTIALAAFLLLCAAASHAAAGKLVLDQMILPVTEDIVAEAIAKSVAGGHSVLVIKLSTPGGLEVSTRRIINRILTSPVPVVVWVAPSGERAASAGFFILEAADIAAMAPGTNTGAAHPILLGQEVDDVLREKMQNDSAALMRSIVAKRGRNVEEAESAVRKSTAFTEQEALQKRLIDVIAADEQSLLRAIHGRTIRRFDGKSLTLDLSDRTLVEIPLSLRHRLLSYIMDPNIAFVLLSIGMLALWAEFQHPGAILPGVVGALAILLAVIALNMMPTRYAALALILASFAFFALEVKFTSHGLFGIAGVVTMFLGGILLVEGPIPEMRVSWTTALAVSVSFGAIAVFLMGIAIRALKNRVTTGAEGMVGEIGVARTRLDPAGKVFVHGEVWDARAERPVAQGAAVRVTRVRDLKLEVEDAGSPETRDVMEERS
ncbi:MAG TPA: nodulation protein NfeD, partial [Thermoanaerobaculia bacterium]|nr:nodulation protein NfeD [Thermoanaerobaculia bacterium]